MCNMYSTQGNWIEEEATNANWIDTKNGVSGEKRLIACGISVA